MLEENIIEKGKNWGAGQEETKLDSVILRATKKELSRLEQRVSSIQWGSKLIILDPNRQKDGCVKIG